MVLTIGVLIQGGLALFSSMLREMNDDIAKRVAANLRLPNQDYSFEI